MDSKLNYIEAWFPLHNQNNHFHDWRALVVRYSLELVEWCTTEFFLFFQQATGTMYPLLCIFAGLKKL